MVGAVPWQTVQSARESAAATANASDDDLVCQLSSSFPLQGEAFAVAVTNVGNNIYRNKYWRRSRGALWVAKTVSAALKQDPDASPSSHQIIRPKREATALHKPSGGSTVSQGQERSARARASRFSGSDAEA